MEADREDGSVVPSSSAEAGTDERVQRLQQLVEMLGGNRKAARRSGVPLSTLNGYLAGGGMKLVSAAAIARAAGVRLEWLATGEPPMAARGAAAAPPAAGLETETIPSSVARTGLAEPSRMDGASGGIGIAWQVNPDRLAQAYEKALNGFAVAPGRRPDAKRLMQVTMIIYDDLTDAAEAAKSPQKPL